jgi:Domain of unknown function (DUF4340)
MLKRGTVLLMMGAIALTSGVLLFEAQQRSSSEAPSEAPLASSLPDGASKSAAGGETEGEGELIFAFAEADVDGVTVKRPDGTLAFSKSADGSWQMTQPKAELAESGAIAFLLSQLTNPTARTLNVQASKLQDFGLADSDTTVTLSAKGKSYQLAVGTADFSGDKLYVRAIEAESADSTAADSTAADLIKIHVVSGGLENAVNRPAAEWLATASETTDSEVVNPEATNPEAADPEAEPTAVIETEPARESGSREAASTPQN